MPSSAHAPLIDEAAGELAADLARLHEIRDALAAALILLAGSGEFPDWTGTARTAFDARWQELMAGVAVLHLAITDEIDACTVTMLELLQSDAQSGQDAA